MVIAVFIVYPYALLQHLTLAGSLVYINCVIVNEVGDVVSPENATVIFSVNNLVTARHEPFGTYTILPVTVIGKILRYVVVLPTVTDSVVAVPAVNVTLD